MYQKSPNMQRSFFCVKDLNKLVSLLKIKLVDYDLNPYKKAILLTHDNTEGYVS